MSTYHKTAESYREGARALPGEYYTTPDMFREEPARLGGRCWYCVGRETNRQDWHISELSHAGIASRVYAPGPYSPRESVPAAWDRAYLDFMGKGEEGKGG